MKSDKVEVDWDNGGELAVDDKEMLNPVVQNVAAVEDLYELVVVVVKGRRGLSVRTEHEILCKISIDCTYI